MYRYVLVWLLLAGLICARPDGVRFLRWSDVQALAVEIKDVDKWDDWIRERDFTIRGRIDHGIEDSISELILFGTSFPGPPKLTSAAAAVNAAGDLTANARARVDAFIQGLDQLDTDRFRLFLDFLRKRKITQEELPAFLSGSLRRFALEEIGLPKNQARADVGISPETSLLINFAVDDALRSLKASGTLPARIRRVAVIGPGLDLAGDPEVYDNEPPQSIQPFAVLESVLRLGGQPGDVQVAALDMNPFVIAHLKSVASKARSGQRATLQLPRPTSGWNSAAIAYWQRFGEVIGSVEPTTALAPPGFDLRAIEVKPQIAARITVEDVDVVAQTLEVGTDHGFDLVVATNVFGYYNHLEQSLALTSIARMMSTGGVLLTNGIKVPVKIAELENLGSRHVAFTENGASGDDILMLRHR